MRIDSSERRRETIALLRLASFGMEDAKKGRVMSGREVIDRLKAKYFENSVEN